MILKSFSKINLSLTVNRKLKKRGLHDIQSYFCLINLFDEIKIKKIKGRKDIVKFQGKFAKYIKKTSNSIIDVLTILRKKNLISNYYSVLVNKKIPVFAGMGGGTSNAVCLIKYFTRNKINKNLLNILDKKIGSDLKLFFYEQGFLKNLKTINVFRRKTIVEEDWRQARYAAFDIPSMDAPFEERINALQELVDTECAINPRCPLVMTKQTRIRSRKHLQDMFEDVTSKSGEGIMIRKDCEYKGKRSNDILKVKKMHDEEYKIMNRFRQYFGGKKGKKRQ